MDSELSSQWQVFQENAMARLRGTWAVHLHLQSAARGCIFPVFEDASAYEVLLPSGAKGGPAGGRRVVWRRRSDVARFQNPVTRAALTPTLEITDVELPHADVQALLGAIPEGGLAPIPEEKVGVDGVACELMLGNVFTESNFRWWVAPPPGWQPLATVLNGMRDLVDRHANRAR